MSASAPQTIAVVGAGSWGTALAIQLARAGCKVRLGGVVEILGRRRRELEIALLGELRPDDEESIGVRIGQGAENDSVEHREDRAVGADPESQRDGHSEDEARRSP